MGSGLKAWVKSAIWLPKTGRHGHHEGLGFPPQTPHPCYHALPAHRSDILIPGHTNFPQGAWSWTFVLLAYSTPWLAGHAPAISEAMGSFKGWFVPWWLLLWFPELAYPQQNGSSVLLWILDQSCAHAHHRTLKTMENHSLQNILLSGPFVLHRNGPQDTSLPAAMSLLANSWTCALL